MVEEYKLPLSSKLYFVYAYSLQQLDREKECDVIIKQLKTIGSDQLDYWQYLTLYYHDSIEEVWEQFPDSRFFYCSTHAKNRYDEVTFQDGDFLVFGKETAGLPKPLLAAHAKEAIRIPMGEGQRSLNLSNAVAIVVYEALRQNDFFGMR